MDLSETIKNAGVVGAGGAGFPSHVKLAGKVEYLIANGAECEPLLCKDKELMRNFAPEIMNGLRAARGLVKAENVIIGIKGKYVDEIHSLKGSSDNSVKFHAMDDIYPAGDEFVLVYEATGMLVPPGGIPLEIGCVVVNVETLYNIGLALAGKPVTDKFLTVAGAVRKPATFRVPVGISIADCIRLAGGAAVDDFAVLAGGAMMGELIADLTDPSDMSSAVTKTMAGLIVLPKEHGLIHRRSLNAGAVRRIGASACDQCYRCTELCPRWLLGYQIEPHQVMRSLLFGGERWELYSKYSLNCCECNICSLYACPEDLDPKNICAWSKRELFARGIRPGKSHGARENPTRFGRQVPTRLLTRKLGLSQYDVPAPYAEIDFIPERVVIPLKQHTGAPATPIVKVGDKVKKGDLIGEIPAGNLGARVHASIDGKVESIGEAIAISRK